MNGQTARALRLTVFFAAAWRLTAGNPSHSQRQTNAGAPLVTASSTALAQSGRKLFSLNCAHCHGDDARGDEGPDLYDLKLSDATIARRIKEGIKGEMPKFGEKFSDDDVKAIIAFMRSLKN